MFHPMMHTRSRSIWRLRPDPIPAQQLWRWPLGPIGDRDPIVLAEHISKERRGVDLGYTFDTSPHVPVYAAQTGVVMFAGKTRSGYAVSIDHGKYGWATYYAHLSTMLVAPPNGHRSHRVRGGDAIGFAARSPTHVRFELWNWDEERGFVAVDPIEQMTQWIRPLTRGAAQAA